MQFRYIAVLALLFLASTTAPAAQHTIVDNGFSFSPTPLTINVGDTVTFTLNTMHNAVEVTQNTWNSNGNTSNGGFNLPFGGGTVIFTIAGTYYYVCAPHASSGMKGIINVVLNSVSTGSVFPTTYCRGGGLTVPFTATGSFNSGNVFTAQLSDAGGSFAAATSIGTLAGTTSGQINATVPSGTPLGNGYRVRVTSSNPVLIGNNNGTDLTVLDAVTATIIPAGPATFCNGDDVTLDANTGAGLTYVWRLNGNTISGAGAASYVATLAGLYTVEVSNGPCSAVSAAVRVTVIPDNPATLTWTGTVDADWSTLGNWDNPCAIPTPGDTVIIGSGTSVPAAIPAIALGKLTLNNSTGLTLTNDLNLNGDLVLTSGNITIGAFHLTLSSSATISGAGMSSYVITNGVGELRQAGIGSGGRTGAIFFPIGPDGSNYTPLLLGNSSTQDEFRVRVRGEVLEDGDTGSPLTTDVASLTWFISEATPGGSNASLTFQWNSGNELSSFDRTSCYVARHNGTDWVALQPPGLASGSAPYQRSITGVATFSPFAIGDAESPLPVEYRSLTADLLDDAVLIRWVTAREVNSSGFVVERTPADHNHWKTLSFIPSAAAPGAGTGYQYMDQPPAPGEWRYRLKQIDMDGRIEYSPNLTVQYMASPSKLVITSVYPDPAGYSAASDLRVTFTVPETGPATLKLYDMLGRQAASVFEGQVLSNQQHVVRFDASALQPGMYMYLLMQNGRAASRRMVRLH